MRELFRMLTMLGVLDGCKSMSICQESREWRVYGNFQDKNGVRSAKVAAFDNCADAIELRRLFLDR